MKPTAVALKVLYLFAGIERKADIGACLCGIVSLLNPTLNHHHIDLLIENVDTKRGGAAHNLLDKARQDSFLGRIRDGEFDVVIVTPNCNKHTRAVFANTDGPKPVRSFEHPRGLPTNTPEMQREAEESDQLLDFSIEVLTAAADAAGKATAWRTTRSLFEFPEDLGEALLGTPASAWQRSDLQALTQHGLTRGAIYQCEFADIDYSKPTGLATTIPDLYNHPRFCKGWPQFTSEFLPGG